MNRNGVAETVTCPGWNDYGHKPDLVANIYVLAALGGISRSLTYSPTDSAKGKNRLPDSKRRFLHSSGSEKIHISHLYT